jgi:hypothetical protein
VIQRVISLQGYVSGMGYIFTKEGLKRLYDKMISRACPMSEKIYEDQEFGRCVADNVFQVDTRDELKRHRFFVHSLDNEIAKFNEELYSSWIHEHNYYPFERGLGCCSPTHVATHHISLERMYLFNHLIRNVSVFGVKKTPKFVLPRKMSRGEIALAAADVDF